MPHVHPFGAKKMFGQKVSVLFFVRKVITKMMSGTHVHLLIGSLALFSPFPPQGNFVMPGAGGPTKGKPRGSRGRPRLRDRLYGPRKRAPMRITPALVDVATGMFVNGKSYKAVAEALKVGVSTARNLRQVGV